MFTNLNKTLIQKLYAFFAIVRLCLVLQSVVLNNCTCLQYVSGQLSSTIPFYSASEMSPSAHSTALLRYISSTNRTIFEPKINSNFGSFVKKHKRRRNATQAMLKYNVLLLMVEKSLQNRFDLVHIGPAIEIAVNKCRNEYKVDLNVHKGKHFFVVGASRLPIQNDKFNFQPNRDGLCFSC